VFAYSGATFVSLTVLLAVACIQRNFSLAGFLLTPDFVAGAQLLLLWGKVPYGQERLSAAPDCHRRCTGSESHAEVRSVARDCSAPR
jgi:hypothetical protein